MKKIGLCSDHAGFDMKEHVKEWLKGRGMDFVDYGTYSSESCDYPDFAHKLGQAIQNDEVDEGIAVCGTGNGISMTLNTYPKVRAGLCWNREVARLVRQHNNANVLAIAKRKGFRDSNFFHEKFGLFQQEQFLILTVFFFRFSCLF